MKITNIDIVARDGLSKRRFGFEYKYGELRYAWFFVYNRDSKKEKWGHDWPLPISYDEWVKIDERRLDDEWEYDRYCRSLNPCRKRTKDGKSKLSGQSCGDISKMPPCPNYVAKRALIKFRNQTKVRYK